MKENGLKTKNIIQLQSIYLVFFILIFCFIFVINYLSLSHNFSSNLISKTSENVSSEFFLYLMASEISQLNISLEEELDTPSISRTLFLAATNIWPEDVRTFLGREIPGFSNFKTEIAVAGIGTNLTTLPVESAPPLEVLLKERELAKKELSESETKDNDKGSLPLLETEKDVVFIYHSHSWEAFLPLLSGKKLLMKLLVLVKTKTL